MVPRKCKKEHTWRSCTTSKEFCSIPDLNRWPWAHKTHALTNCANGACPSKGSGSRTYHSKNQLLSAITGFLTVPIQPRWGQQERLRNFQTSVLSGNEKQSGVFLHTSISYLFIYYFKTLVVPYMMEDGLSSPQQVVISGVVNSRLIRPPGSIEGYDHSIRL